MFYAAEVATEKGYIIILFTLQNVSIHALNACLSSDEINKHTEHQKTRFEDVAASLSSLYDLKILSHFATGDFFEELETCIAQYEADMVIVGMASNSFEQDLLGNTTTELLGRLKLPVLAVPLAAKYRGMKRILFACDIERGVQKSIIEKVKAFTRDFDSSVEVFHVVTEFKEGSIEGAVDKAPDELKFSLKEMGYLYKDVKADEVLEAIKKEIERLRADILIMVPFKYGFWGSLVHQSKTRMMAAGSSVPLLSIPL